MIFLYTVIKKFEPLFTGQGKLALFFPVYEAAEVFFFVPANPTTRGAHIRDHIDMKRMMMTVVIALQPAMLFGIYNIGFQYFSTIGKTIAGFEAHMWCFLVGLRYFVPIFITAFAVGGFWEVLFAVVRKHEINEGFFVTGFLIPLLMPPTIPLWQVAVATTFGVVIGKEIFGGTGMNIFNPAIVTRAFIFFAYSKSVSGNDVWAVKAGKIVDAYTQATPLLIESLKPTAGSGTLSMIDVLAQKGYSFWNMFLGLIPGSIGETSTIAVLIGALILIVAGVGSWRIMVSIFAGGFVMVTLLNFFAPGEWSFLALPAHYHFVMGSFAFGAVFMATDPVSAAATYPAQIVYGFLVGVLIIIIRAFNPGFKEGTLLAILFMNAFAPLIDHFVIRRNIQRRLRYAKSG